MILPLALRDEARTLLLLFLGSDQEGERRNATAALSKLFRRHGVDLHDLAAVLVGEEPPLVTPAPAIPELRIHEGPPGIFQVDSPDFMQLAEAIRKAVRLNDWEAKFLKSLEERADVWVSVRLSQKQIRIFTGLLQRIQL